VSEVRVAGWVVCGRLGDKLLPFGTTWAYHRSEAIRRYEGGHRGLYRRNRRRGEGRVVRASIVVQADPATGDSDDE